MKTRRAANRKFDWTMGSSAALVAAVLATTLFDTSALAQVPAQPPFQPAPGQQIPGQRPIYNVAQQPGAPFAQPQPVGRPTPPPTPTGEVAPGEHPLMPALNWAKSGLEYLRSIPDYTCVLVKRERIDGVLGEHEYMSVKVRQKPFSVYMRFLAPDRVKDQEAIYVEGKNDGKLLGHPNGLKHKLIGTVALLPTSPLAMAGNRYPITQVGLLRLVERLIEVAEQDVQYGECDVKWIRGAKINDRTCTCIQVTHPVPRRNFLFNVARIFIDDEAHLPIRYEAYDWPAEGTTEPRLTEEYTYLNLKIDNGYTDADFDTRNPNYLFK